LEKIYIFFLWISCKTLHGNSFGVHDKCNKILNKIISNVAVKFMLSGGTVKLLHNCI
jgi:hypothetical protein